jgi:[ribosomal protein S18]-alanine N-acetyltransferase
MIFKDFDIGDIDKFIQFIEDNSRGIAFFHPHKFDYNSIKEMLEKKKKDVYVLMVEDDIILGYGMLRGWDEGYDIPSLGIIIDEIHRGKGLSIELMNFLYRIAKSKKSKFIRLTVEKDNYSAISLYQKLGYELKNYKNNSLEGLLKIN